jgi:subtilisin family serine protease
MEWAAEQGVEVLSMSLGFSPGEAFEQDFEEAINNLVFLNIFPAIAIGNEGRNTSRAPGINAQSWSVGATDRSNQVATFSGGQMVRRPADSIQPDIAAPGVDVYSAIPGGGYQFSSGTSMATPHVAGVVALLRQANPHATVNDLKQVLAETALDLGKESEDIRYGWGLLRPVDALETLLS